MTPVSTFFDRLQAVVPELAELRRAHESFNGELLGHVLMPDITTWMCEHLHDDPVQVDALLTEIAAHLRPEDDPVSNIIGVSFLEGLGGTGASPAEIELRRRLPGSLAAELQRMESWRP